MASGVVDVFDEPALVRSAWVPMAQPATVTITPAVATATAADRGLNRLFMMNSPEC
jgi:hypothetical protein